MTVEQFDKAGAMIRAIKVYPRVAANLKELVLVAHTSRAMHELFLAIERYGDEVLPLGVMSTVKDALTSALENKAEELTKELEAL